MRKKILAFLLCVFILCMLNACTKQQDTFSIDNRNTDISKDMELTGTMELDYADQFAVDYYKDGFALVTISDGSQYLVIPEGQEAPGDLPEDIVLLQQPINNVYLVASAVMDMFVSMKALDTIRFSAIDADGWYIEPAKEAMESGDIVYAGKYSAYD